MIRRGTSLAGYGAGILLMGAILAALTRSRAGVAFALVLLAVAVVVRLVAWKRSGRFEFAVTPGGLTWTDPARGARALRWGEIGAVVVRESPATGEESTALFVVPREADAGPGCVLSVGALGRTTDDGMRRLREAAELILPRLPADVIIDRRTRLSLMRWGVKVSVP